MGRDMAARDAARLVTYGSSLLTHRFMLIVGCTANGEKFHFAFLSFFRLYVRLFLNSFGINGSSSVSKPCAGWEPRYVIPDPWQP